MFDLIYHKYNIVHMRYRFLLLLISMNTIILGSGGFGGGIDQIQGGNDREKFQLGKSIYNQEIELKKNDALDEVAQSERLKYLQNSLPNPEKKRVDLPSLAGKLSAAQLKSLEYFLKIRFNLKLE
ncbi:MAG: hypothetical protein SFU98_02695 [Leptospiraceae bacterium]|nr:hypothetical protein [Leptospiraceae bacterium]